MTQGTAGFHERFGDFGGSDCQLEVELGLDVVGLDRSSPLLDLFSDSRREATLVRLLWRFGLFLAAPLSCVSTCESAVATRR